MTARRGGRRAERVIVISADGSSRPAGGSAELRYGSASPQQLLRAGAEGTLPAGLARSRSREHPYNQLSNASHGAAGAVTAGISAAVQRDGRLRCN